MQRQRVGRGIHDLACVAALLLLTACSSDAILQSRHIPATQTTPLAGVSYYLPKKVLTVSVWQFKGTKLTPAFDANGAPLLDPAGQPLMVRKMNTFATLDSEAIIPDLRHQFLIEPQWDKASDDLVQVDLTENGLLTAVRGRAEDKRADIVSELAKLASLLIRGPAPIPGGAMRGLNDKDPTRPRLIASFSFDPVDPVDRERVSAQLQSLGVTLELTKQSDCPTATSGAECCTTCTSTSPGIYYRLPLPYRLRLSPGGVFRQGGYLGAQPTGEWEYLDHGLERTVLLPNEAICLYVPVDRRRFVTSQTAMTFDQGMLRSVTTDKPSELLGFVKIPVDVASQLLAVPSELLTIRIQQKTQEAELANAETRRLSGKTDLMNAELELLKAMQNYQRAKAAEGETNADK